MSGLNRTQKGVAGQHEFAKLAILGGGGRLELDAPAADDDRIDYFMHLKNEFGRHLATQVKVSTTVARGRLVIYFSVPRERLHAGRSFWYFFALLDLSAMGFRDPVFLVPSAVVHRLGRRMRNGRVRFSLSLSMRPQSRDRWVPYRLQSVELGKRLVEVIEAQPFQRKGLPGG